FVAGIVHCCALRCFPTRRSSDLFEAYHWHVIHEIDGHDPQAVKEAILEAQSVKDKPSLIICRTVIGFGSPNKAGKEEAHGAPLGDRKSTRLNSSHVSNSYAVYCL